ncbi:hypothetical protein [Sphingomonas sp. R86521]|uniref:hypothetical protein n=1 Tax=Sphingomonas sp. R86521 TaxID=3093860 RepID=UPI0036D397FC
MIYTTLPIGSISEFHDLFGTGDLTPEAQAHAEPILPMQVQRTIGQTVTIDTDMIVGPNATPEATIADALIFKGGSLTVKSTALTIRAGRLPIAPGRNSNYPYHLGVLGSTEPLVRPGLTVLPTRIANGTDRSPEPRAPSICTGADADGKAPKPASLARPNTPCWTIQSCRTSSAGLAVMPFRQDRRMLDHQACEPRKPARRNRSH